MRGKGKVVGGKDRLRECLSYVEDKLPITAYELNISTLKSFKRAVLGDQKTPFVVETEQVFQNMCNRGVYKTPRQKYWVAGHFIRQAEYDPHEESSKQSVTDVYYGSVNEFWEI